MLSIIRASASHRLGYSMLTSRLGFNRIRSVAHPIRCTIPSHGINTRRGYAVSAIQHPVTISPLDPLLDHPSWHVQPPLEMCDTIFFPGLQREDLCFFPPNLPPISLGQTFNQGQYQIIHCLGVGTRSIVWLARDRALHGYVALKFLVPEFRQDIIVNLHLQQIQTVTPLRVCPILNQFISEPTGHLCQVLPVAGPVLWKSFHGFARATEPHAMAAEHWALYRHFFRQTVEAIALLHEHGIVHGNLNPQKILLQLHDIDYLTLDELYCYISEPSIYAVGTGNNSHFPYIVEPADMNLIPTRLIKPQVFLGSLSSPRYARQHNIHVITPEYDSYPNQYNAPEVLRGSTPSFASDVWSIAPALWDGCVSTDCLFSIGGVEGETIPASRRDTCQYINDQMGISARPENQVESLEEGVYSAEAWAWQQILEEKGLEDDGTDHPENLSELPRVLRRVLKFSEAERVSAADLIQDPWFGSGH